VGKTLAKIIGTVALGLMGFNLNAQNRIFLKENYDKFILGYKPVNIIGDSIPDVIQVDYDLNRDGKRDARALFIITSRDSINYHTEHKAFMLIFDEDEDGKDDDIFGDKDFDGILESHVKVKNVKIKREIAL
jgi:hypothetical protein